MARDESLLTAAFGDDPGRWPLQAATTSYQRWLRAVAAGGQGRYAIATAELAALRRDVGSEPLASLAHSTHASFLRQLGGHFQARRWDARAAATAGSDAEATADALLGLAADALGIGRFAASAALLERARAPLGGAEAQSRLPVRWQWVAAELAMARGDGAEAVDHAERAVELAGRLPSARHRVKTQVVYAAALCSAGRIDDARAAGDKALSETSTLGLLPLQWAVASLLADIGSDTTPADDVVGIQNACAEAIRRAGGDWRR